MDYEKLYKEAIARIRKYTKDEYGCTRLKPEDIFPELAKSEDVVIKEKIIATIHLYYGEPLEDEAKEMIAWLENKGEKKLILPKWKYKKDNTPLLRDSLILNKYGCVAKSPSGALVSDVWVIDYDELAKLPKEVFEKQGEQKPAEFDDTNAKRMFIKALERVEEQNNKGYKLTDCDKNSWWEDFKAYTSCIVEQKPWSEEDERLRTSCIKHIEEELERIRNDKYGHSEIISDLKESCRERINWLESLKDRVQRKQEWSEEDKAILEKCIGAVKVSCYSYSFKSEAENWLKSLRPQSQWKPSEEQMKALNTCIMQGEISYVGQGTELQSLYNDLKKLTE